MSRPRLRFDYGCYFPDSIKITSFNSGQDFLIGALDENEAQGILIGKVAEFDGDMGRDVWLDTKGAHVVYIIGKRRGGKSYTLGAIAEGLVESSFQTGKTDQSVLVLDTLNIFWTIEDPPGNTPLEKIQLDELQKWNLSPSGLSKTLVFYPRGHKREYYPQTYKEFSLKPSDLDAADWASLFELDLIADPMGQLIGEIFQKVVHEGYQGDQQRIGPNVSYDVDDLLKCIQIDPDLARFEKNTVEALSRRLRAVKSLSLFHSQGTDVRQLFSPGFVSVILLRDLDAQLRGLVVGLLTKKIMELRGITCELEKRIGLLQAKASRIGESNDPRAKGLSREIERLQERVESGVARGWILIDEGHNYIPQLGIIGSKAPLKRYVNEGRNLGLSLAITTQQPSGLDGAIRRNADVLFIHSISMKGDLEATESMLNTMVPEESEISRSKVTTRVFEKLARDMPLGYCVVSCANASRVFVMKVRPRISAHGGAEY